jgi:ribosomal protein S18 acetylase RimI-like enzyme
VRTATAADVGAIRSLIAHAFADDPLLRWIFPDDAHRLEQTAAWLGLFVEGAVRGGRVDLLQDGDDLVAVALWRMPDDPRPAAPPTPTVGGLLAAFVGTARAEELGRGLRVFSAAWPEEPFAYLHFLAVAPDAQRRGLGARVLRHGVARASEAGLGTELETTNPANLPFYAAAGFRVSRELALEPDGPPAWALWRDPGDGA